MWPFKAKETEEERKERELKDSLRKQVERYEQAQNEDDTDYTNIDFGNGPLKVMKINMGDGQDTTFNEMVDSEKWLKEQIKK